MLTLSFPRAALVAAMVLSVGGPASAYTPQWLACSGELSVTTENGTTKQPVTDIYVYDQDTHNLFKYSESQKRLTLTPATQGPDQKLHWQSESGGFKVSRWQGTLDRSSMALQVSYKNAEEARAWDQTCKPTDPRPES